MKILLCWPCTVLRYRMLANSVPLGGCPDVTCIKFCLGRWNLCPNKLSEIRHAALKIFQTNNFSIIGPNYVALIGGICPYLLTMFSKSQDPRHRCPAFKVHESSLHFLQHVRRI